MKLILKLCFFAILWLPLVAQAQLSGGGEAYPELKTNQKALKAWQDLRFGMFIHWDPVSLRGQEIGWSRGTSIPISDYDNLYREFNPVLFNAAEWVKTAKEAGMKYMVLVTKHHDGFCLWPSAYTDYDIASTPYGKDIVGQLATECKKQGLLFGTYYSVLDWHHPDYTTRHGADTRPVDSTTMVKYIDYLHNQVAELINKYHTNILWYDGEWEKSWTHKDGMKLYKFCRDLKDNLIINNRVDKGRKGMGGISEAKFAGDYWTPEQKIGNFDVVNAWESCITIGKQWAWKPNDEIKSTRELIHTLALTAGGGGNLLLNVGPMLDGRMEQRQINRLNEMGAWLKRYGASIYGTRGGPYKPTNNLSSTHFKNKIFLHILNWPEGTLTLPSLEKVHIKSIKRMNGELLTFKDDGQNLVINLPEKAPNPYDTVIIIELDQSAETINPMEITTKLPS